MLQFEKDIKRFTDKVWLTRKSRFNASQRLLSRQKSFTWGILILTIAQLALSVFLLTADEVTNPKIEFIASSSIMISFLVSIFSSTIMSTIDGVEAHKFHACALELGTIYSQVQGAFGLPITERIDLVKSCEESYAAIMIKYDSNHELIDMDLVKAQHYKEFKLNIITSILIKFKFLIAKYGSIFLLFAIATVIEFFFYNCFL